MYGQDVLPIFQLHRFQFLRGIGHLLGELFHEIVLYAIQPVGRFVLPDGYKGDLEVRSDYYRYDLYPDGIAVVICREGPAEYLSYIRCERDPVTTKATET